MKTLIPLSFRFLSVGLLALVLTACPKTTAYPADRQVTAADLDTLKAQAFAKRADFIAGVKDAAAKIDAQVADLSGRTASAPAGSTARTQALDELKVARADLDSQLGKLDSATVETWDSLRDEVLATLARAQSACDKAMKS